MPKIQPHALKHRDLLKRLRIFDISEIITRGKGSERILIKSGIGSKYKGPQIPIKYHGEGTEHSVRVINSVLRRFNIDPEIFWSA